MTRIQRLVLVLGCLALPSGCAAQTAGSAPQLTAEQWRADLRHFARELTRRHANVFHTVSRQQFEEAVARLDSVIPSLQPHEVVVRMKQIAALVGDAHTRVHIPPWFTLYPLTVYWFGDELRVTTTLPEYRRALGARVIGIGALDIAEIHARVGTTFPTAAQENDWYVLSMSTVLIRPETLHALGVVRDLGPAPFRFRDDDGAEFTLDIRPIPTPALAGGAITLSGFVSAASQPPLFRQRPAESFWFTWLPDSQTVYVSFRGYRSLGEHARELFAQLDRKPPQRLIIDMRQNGGGDFNVGRRHLVEAIRRRPHLNQKGRLYVVVGRRTFSAAMANAVHFRDETNAILVGEPIGERPNSYSENDEFTLPASRVVVSYSTRYYRFVLDDAPAVMPDVRIDPTWPEFRDGRDRVLEWILEQRP